MRSSGATPLSSSAAWTSPSGSSTCCSGDLADLKVKSCDIEAWSPRQQKYFEVCSCSNLGDAQARRLKIRVRGEDGKLYLAHTLNNTCVAPPRMLIAFLENNLNADGTVTSRRCCGRTWAARPNSCRTNKGRNNSRPAAAGRLFVLFGAFTRRAARKKLCRPLIAN